MTSDHVRGRYATIAFIDAQRTARLSEVVIAEGTISGATHSNGQADAEYVSFPLSRVEIIRWSG